MDFQTKERMDGLVTISAIRQLKEAALEIFADLCYEGFTTREVEEYVEKQIMERREK